MKIRTILGRVFGERQERPLSAKASAVMEKIERMRAMGLTEARWRYSGAPCYSTRAPTPGEIAMDKAHREADKDTFHLKNGKKVNGIWTFPGVEDGCKCVANPVIPGFDS